jgi:hypothetical protein
MFNGSNVDVMKIIELLETKHQDILLKLSKICTGEDPKGEIDAVAGLVNFFLQIMQEAKESGQLIQLLEKLPTRLVPVEMKAAILNLIGRI